MTRYKQRKDGEGFEVPSSQIYRIACCDCGLVHDFVFVSQDGNPIGIAAKRNNRSTAQRRKNNNKWINLTSDQITNIAIQHQSLHQIAKSIQEELRRLNHD
jgi:hypothetical protein